GEKCGTLAALAEGARFRICARRSITRRAERGARAKPGLRGPALVREVRLDLAGDLVESRLVGNGEVREHLAVDVDVGALQARHERAVAHAELAHRGVDARDPQRAELALPLAAVAIGILP